MTRIRVTPVRHLPNGEPLLPGFCPTKMRRCGRRRRNEETDISKSIQDWADLNPGIIHLDRLVTGSVLALDWASFKVALRTGNVRAIRYRKVVGARKGSPDRIGVVPCGNGLASGRYVAIEVKVPGNEPDAAQLAIHEKFRKAGAIMIVASGVDELDREYKAALARIRAEETP